MRLYRRNLLSRPVSPEWRSRQGRRRNQDLRLTKSLRPDQKQRNTRCAWHQKYFQRKKLKKWTALFDNSSTAKARPDNYFMPSKWITWNFSWLHHQVEAVKRDLNVDGLSGGSGSKPSSRSSSRSASPAFNKKSDLLATDAASGSNTPTPGTPTIHKSASKWVNQKW